MKAKRSTWWGLVPVSLAALAGGLWLGCEDAEPAPNAAGVVSEGAGCLGSLPTAFPYQPGCCDYAVGVPAVTEAGFSSAVLGSAPSPDHVHVSWAGDPSSTFAVNWRTGPDTLVSEVLFGTDEALVAAADGPTAGVTRIVGHHMLYGSIFDGETRTRVHEAHVCGLSPSTRYFYKAGGSGAWSAVYDVATGPVGGSEEVFSFAVTGDSRNDTAVWADVQAAISGRAVDFQLFSGDAVVIGQKQAEWDAFFEATTGPVSVQDVLARTPFMVANGNHEALAINYVAQFALPQEASPGESEPEEWYSFDYGNAHFVFLNDTTLESSETSTQRDWLDQDLGAVDRAKTPWIFVVHHKSAYSCSTNHGSDTALRAAWQPIFDKHKVDIVFNGHDHNYERSKPIRGFQPGSIDGEIAPADGSGGPVAESGTVYVVAAGAGAPLYGVDTTCFHTLLAESTRNYVIAQVEGRTLRYRAYRLNGSELDSFDYTK